MTNYGLLFESEDFIVEFYHELLTLKQENFKKSPWCLEWKIYYEQWNNVLRDNTM